MAVKTKHSGRALSMPAGIGLGTGVAVGISVIGAVILACMVAGESLQMENIGAGCMVILVIASALGSITAAQTIKRHRLQVCMITALCYYLVLTGINALLFDAQYVGMLVTAAVVGITSAGVSFVGIGGGKRSKFRYKNRASG